MLLSDQMAFGSSRSTSLIEQQTTSLAALCTRAAVDDRTLHLDVDRESEGAHRVGEIQSCFSVRNIGASLLKSAKIVPPYAMRQTELVESGEH
jgi:hypothetical protein